MRIGARLTIVLIVVLGIATALIWWQFRTVLEMHRARVAVGSQVVSWRFGQIEYAAAGDGPPVLVVHGAGGGFDQGVAAAVRLMKAGHRIFAPSRFGYLRSTIPDDPSLAQQAEAFAVLLDELHIERVAVVGLSVGSLSALQFAVRHPERCRSLTVLVPAASAVMTAQGPLPEQGPVMRRLVELVFRSDFLYWLGISLARDAMIRAALATDPAVVAAASPDERQRVYDILRNLLPIRQRSRGLLNDAHVASVPQAIAVERIKAPTLVISLEDDFYRTLAPARAIAASVPGARLIVYPTGGHAFAGREADAFAEVEAFITQH